MANVGIPTDFVLYLPVPSPTLAWVSAVPPYAAGLADIPIFPVRASVPSGSVVASTLNRNVFIAGIDQQEFLYDFYFKIWVFPGTLQLRNPRTGVPIPFVVWNAYPYSNNITAINTTGATGITLDQVVPDTYRLIEYRTVNLTITPSAPLSISATFSFVFANGTGLFTLLVDRASIVAIVPDVPVAETWSWLTDIMVTNDGTEQRVGLRSSPRRAQQAKLTAVTEAEITAIMKQFQFDTVGLIVVPYFQYATELTADVPLGGVDLVFDPSKTDVRALEYVFILTRAGAGEMVQLSALSTVGATSSTPLTIAVPAGSIICPAFTSIVRGNAGVSRYAVKDAASIDFRSEVSTIRAAFSRPNSLATVVTYDTYPVLTQQPLADDLLKEDFDTGAEIFDYETGYTEIVTRWKYTKDQGDRKFLIHRYNDPTTMDWWRDFLNAVQGRLNPFLMPTWRGDVTLFTPPVQTSNQLVVTGADYASLYFPMDPYKRLCLWTANGPLYVTVLSSAIDANGNSACTISTAIPTGVGWTQVTLVSYLLKMRLLSDTIQLDHRGLDTLLTLSLRTVPE